MDTAKIEAGVRMILEGVGENPDREGLKETPARVARMYEEVFAGSTDAARASRSEAMSLILRETR